MVTKPTSHGTHTRAASSQSGRQDIAGLSASVPDLTGYSAPLPPISSGQILAHCSEWPSPRDDYGHSSCIGERLRVVWIYTIMSSLNFPHTTTFCTAGTTMASAGLQLPPGPKFVLRHVHYLFGPPALTFATLRALRRVGGLPVPFWLTCILTLLSFPLFFIGNTIWRDLSKKRRAAALGAQLPPIAEQVKDDLRDGDKRFPRMFVQSVDIRLRR